MVVTDAESRLTKKRYYCDDCMDKYHNHRPIYIVKKTFEIGQKWLDHDSTLAHIEKEFNKNMHDYMDLITHFEDVAKTH